MRLELLTRSGLASLALASAVTAVLGAETAEGQLRRALANVAEGRVTAALDDLDGVISRYPNFRLAHLVRGDLLLARTQVVSVLHAPGAKGVIEVMFDQDYRSNNLSQCARKRQYWVEEGDRWKIAYESTVGGQKLRLPESFPQARKRPT